MGFQSYAFRWFFGYSVGGSVPPQPPEPVLCPCPEYKVDATLSNQFMKEASLSNQFSKEQTLTNQWAKRNCNG